MTAAALRPDLGERRPADGSATMRMCRPVGARGRESAHCPLPGSWSGPALDPERAKAEILELADVVKSLRLHWRVSVAIALLSAIFLALFLVTRNEVRPANRYKAAIQLLVPARDEKGKRPAGVPPSLLQGQAARALSQSTRDAALKAARVPTDRRGRIQFTFSQKSDIITLTAIASDPHVATAVASAFKTAYVNTRTEKVGRGLKSGASGAANALARLTARLVKVKRDLRAADPALARSIPDTLSAKANPAGLLPVNTPLATVLLVVEHDELLTRIRQAQTRYAQTITESLIPGGFASTVEVLSPVQITPPLPSPVGPALVFIGIGLALALAAPVLMDRLDKSIRTARTAAVAFDSIVLTSIPPVSRRAQRALAAPGTPLDGAYRALAATSIATDRLPKAIVVMSPTGIVQDTVAANFAAALAGLGLRVALIATDARQTWFLDTSEPVEGGLSFPQLLELAHQGRLDGALPHGLVATRLDNLLVLPPGEKDREFSLDGLGPLLEAVSTSGIDVAVIAGPALLEDPNATILAWITRSVLWAFETGEVTEAEAKEAAARLALAGAASFGVAMVNGKT
jgi:Mrp family chromosome partitioning ATPase